MLDLFFSFRGRIGRLQYFLTALGSTTLIGVVATLGILSVSREHLVGSVLALLGLAALLVVAMLWSSLSLQVRRVRDIGWDPVVVVAGNFVVQVLINLFTITTHHHHYAVSVPVTLAYSGILLFWPGRGPSTPDYDSIFGGDGDLPRHAAMPVSASRLELAGGRAAAPVRRPGRPTKTFGRRGVA